ncbi:protease 2 isoform X3 [Benincasa hispida]|uniref:protease 2 isoform X3 n=1 Tax=Benincasa hispida TaxID=102211 RepID=UPI0018FF6430|nr:protease 2 isoform X3 [Benincasa hispida]
MALKSLLKPKSSITKFFLYSSIASSSRFSSSCKKPIFSLPSQSPPTAKKLPFTHSVHGVTLQDSYHWMSNTHDPDLADYLRQENFYAEAFMGDTQILQQRLFSEMTSRIPAKVSTPPEPWGPWFYYQYIPEGKEYPVLCRRLQNENEKSSWLKKLLQFVKGNFGKEEQVLLDWNEIAKQYGYVHVGTCRVSPDHNFLAYTVDITGSEHFMLQIKDLGSGRIIPELQKEGVVSLAWAEEGRMLFYTQADGNQRPYRVFCTKVGFKDTEDVSVFVENDPNYCVDITSTKDGKFVTVNSNSRTSSEEGTYLFQFFFFSFHFSLMKILFNPTLDFHSETILVCLTQVYIIDAKNSVSGLQRIHKRVPGIQYFLEHHHGFFYILTNAPLEKNGDCLKEDYYVARCRVEDIKSADQQDIILQSEDFSIQDMDLFGGHLVLFVNKNGVPMLCSINLPLDVNDKQCIEIKKLDPWFFPLPSNSCSVAPGSNHDFMSSLYRVVLSSPVMPDLIVDYDMSRRVFSIIQQEEVKVKPGVKLKTYLPDALDIGEVSDAQNKRENFQNSESQNWKDFSDVYYCERKEVISHDGIRIPLTILYSPMNFQKGQSPGVLQGYGAYGEILDKSWCPYRLSLLDRGFVLAFADVRGGSGGGDSSWHRCGSGLEKQNSILDFISCANFLVNNGYIHKDRLGSIGYSAGGLLVGAAINMHPDLFRAAILKTKIFLETLEILKK